MANTRDLLVRINGDASGFEKALGTAGTKSKGFANALDKAKTGSFALLGGLTAAAAGAVFFGVKAATAFNETQTAQAQLEHAVIAVTHATRAQLDATAALSDELEKKGVLDGDNIKIGLAQLSTFGLSNKAVRNLGGSLADLAVNQFGVNASGQELSQTANMIAKALHGQFGVLEKSGIRFTDTQKKMIQFGTEQQKVDAINKGFAQNLKFTNDVARQTAEGGIAHLKVQLGNVQESIGAIVTKAITPMIVSFSKWLDAMGGPEAILKKIGENLQKLQPYLPIITGAILGGLVPAFVAMGGAIWAALAPLLPFIAAGTAIGYIAKLLMDHFGGLSGVLLKLQPILTALSNFWKYELYPSIQAVWESFETRLLPTLQRLWTVLGPQLMPVLKIVALLLGATLLGTLIAVTNGLRLMIGWTSNLINWMITASKWVRGLGDAIASIPTKIAAQGSALFHAIVDPYVKAFEFVKKLIPSSIAKKLHGVVPGFAAGGFTGRGGQQEIAGFVHRGEYVLPQSEVDQITGLPKRSASASVTVQTAQPVAQNVVNFNPNLQVGMFAGMPTEYRDIAERLWVEFTRIAQSNGIKLQPIGARGQ